MVGWIYFVFDYYTRFAVCCFLGIASAASIHFFDINLFLRILLSIALFVSWVCLGLLIEYLYRRDKKGSNEPPGSSNSK